ncbi:MAG TPA: hypothetical protein VFF78_06530, partial [Anaerolineaceae bacterium]|nr:hypothetical protein [Anaerolineaceae bacterium]
MFSLRNRKIKNCIEKIRTAKQGDLKAIWTLQEIKATEAVPELMDILRDKVKKHSSTSGWVLAALSEIGCSDQSDDLLNTMISEVDHHVQMDRSVWGTRPPSMLWETRSHYLEAVSRCKVEDFDALLRTFFATGANIDGYLVTCLRILSWKLGIPGNVLQLSIDFNTIYRQANPITCEIFENPIDYAFR